MPFYVYILESLRTGRYYIGQTDALIVRFHQHQDGLSSSTKAYRPWRMPYYETYPTRAEAIKREREIKLKKSAESIRRIIRTGFAELGLEVPQCR